jgi:hypothetical protein
MGAEIEFEVLDIRELSDSELDDVVGGQLKDY